ncbi:hypothetical protein PMAYCL1PPCAC_25259, partial [Pristionchus mayeri]
LSISPEVEGKGIPWQASVSLSNNRKIDAYIECDFRKSMHWSIDLDVEFILVNSDTSKNFFVQDSYTFNNDYYRRNRKKSSTLIVDDSLIDPANGFINGLTFTVEIRMLVSKTRGIKFSHINDFTDPNDPRHDVTLV